LVSSSIEWHPINRLPATATSYHTHTHPPTKETDNRDGEQDEVKQAHTTSPSANECVHFGGGAIVDRDGEAATLKVEDQILPHHGETCRKNSN
jgi:hypothetical protein